MQTPWPSDWLRAALELCVLAVVSQEGPTHGYAVATRLASLGLGEVKGGTLYPLLGRLETEGYLSSTWQPGSGGPGRKAFEVTAAGRVELMNRADRWAAFTSLTTDLARTAVAAPVPTLVHPPGRS